MSHFQHTARLSRSIRGEIRSSLLDGNGRGFCGTGQSKNTPQVGCQRSLMNIVRRPQKHARKAPAHDGTGFLTLPPELRNKVYRLLFTAKKDLIFNFPKNFCLSSTFLRTCRQIHEEGCGILYGKTPLFLSATNTPVPPCGLSHLNRSITRTCVCFSNLLDQETCP